MFADVRHSGSHSISRPIRIEPFLWKFFGFFWGECPDGFQCMIASQNSRAGYRDKLCTLSVWLAARSADADQSEAFLKNVSVLIGLEIECEPE